MATTKKKASGRANRMTPSVRRAAERASRGDARAFTVVLEDIHARLGGITDQLQLHTEKFEAIDRRFEAVDARFDKMDARFDTMDAAFASLGGDVELLKLATIENTRGIARLEARTERLEMKTDRHTEAIERLETKTDTHTLAIRRLETKSDASTEAIRALEIGLARKADRVGS